MISVDEDALICDFAEYYHIYNMQGLQPGYAAVLALGLREESRIQMAMTDRKLDLDKILVASILDAVRWLCWTKSKDGQRGRRRPASVLDQLQGRNDNNDIAGFDTAEEFEAARNRIIRGK